MSLILNRNQFLETLAVLCPNPTSTSLANPRQIEGRLVVLEEYEDKEDRGLRISCPVYGHKCRAYRSIFKDVDKYGRYAATFFLGAWLKNNGDISLQ